MSGSNSTPLVSCSSNNTSTSSLPRPGDSLSFALTRPSLPYVGHGAASASCQQDGRRHMTAAELQRYVTSTIQDALALVDEDDLLDDFPCCPEHQQPWTRRQWRERCNTRLLCLKLWLVEIPYKKRNESGKRQGGYQRVFKWTNGVYTQ